MVLSLSGAKMARVSGIRSIMDDIATSRAEPSAAGWLNLSIGNPAPIPEVVTAWRRLFEQTLTTSFTAASCEYGPSRGTTTLVEAIADYFGRTYGWPVTAENIVVGPGSQTLCFLAAAMFTGPGTGGRIVLPAVPDYTGYQGLCLHADGVAGVAPAIQLAGERRFRYSLDLDAVRRAPDLGMMLLSSPSNPVGRCLDRAELDGLVEVAEQRGVPLIVDHAYGEPFPRIAETQVPPRWHDQVINVFTASKAGLPGERIGFAIGPARYVNPMVSFVSNSVLHAPQLAQLVVARALVTGELDRITTTAIQPYYAAKRRTVEALLAQTLPSSVNWRLHVGSGGMFCWLWVDEPWFDDAALYRLMKSKRVFIVPGRPFFVDPLPGNGAMRAHESRCFRISLSPAEPVLQEGLARIAEALEELRRAH
ncbi:MAG TPA: aminotransferase class I/II-fold pyridoxal phosphate-dependent enzyme [Micromonosporaceae bacterium]|nr:aminotransferase class I/II-fold pyridoxal phosphate-dependent enzyme [Micromonosporaceae bacterium]